MKNPVEARLLTYVETRLDFKETLSKALQEGIKRAANVPGMDGAWIDSHAVAKMVFERRVRMGFSPSPEQTRDYVQHCFRELYWCCRYASDRFYFIHSHKECTPECRARRLPAHLAETPEQPREHCPTCHIQVTTQGTCSMGCDDE